jgi:hypothetical protein
MRHNVRSTPGQQCRWTLPPARRPRRAAGGVRRQPYPRAASCGGGAILASSAAVNVAPLPACARAGGELTAPWAVGNAPSGGRDEKAHFYGRRNADAAPDHRRVRRGRRDAASLTGAATFQTNRMPGGGMSAGVNPRPTARNHKQRNGSATRSSRSYCRQQPPCSSHLLDDLCDCFSWRRLSRTGRIA